MNLTSEDKRLLEELCPQHGVSADKEIKMIIRFVTIAFFIVFTMAANPFFSTASANELSITQDGSQLSGTLTLEDTSSEATGVIYKGSMPFIHNFRHPTGWHERPVGRNFFAGQWAGNFQMGSEAEFTDQASDNTCVGYFSGNSITLGRCNSFYGSHSGYVNETGSFNAFFGVAAGWSNTDGFGNSFFGGSSGGGNLSGTRNSFFGYRAGIAVETGNESVYIGADTNCSADGLTNENVFGYGATGNGSNSVTLGNDEVTKTILRGKVGIDIQSPNEDLEVAGNGRAFFGDGGGINRTGLLLDGSEGASRV